MIRPFLIIKRLSITIVLQKILLIRPSIVWGRYIFWNKSISSQLIFINDYFPNILKAPWRKRRFSGLLNQIITQESIRRPFRGIKNFYKNILPMSKHLRPCMGLGGLAGKQSNILKQRNFSNNYRKNILKAV